MEHARPDDLVIPTPDGLYCAEGGFHIDPWRPVAKAVVTHAHSDHACRGCGEYLCSRTGAFVLRERMEPEASITGIEYGAQVTLGGVRVSLHPAGHILGSAQVRVEHRGRVWVVSGDYKTTVGTPDRTCEPFEPVRCHVFISESTFGLPIYRWSDERVVFDEINTWWRENQQHNRTSVVFAYALGKAQRVLGGIDPAIGPLAVHGAVDRLNRAYRAGGIALPEAPTANADIAAELKGRGLVVAPPSAAGSVWLRKFTGGRASGGVATAFVSGWMRVRGTRRRRAVDRGFVLSDHADWEGLLGAIRATGAERVGVTHGYIQPLVRWLREREKVDAFIVPTRYEGERTEDAPGSASDEGPPGEEEPDGPGAEGGEP